MQEHYIANQISCGVVFPNRSFVRVHEISLVGKCSLVERMHTFTYSSDGRFIKRISDVRLDDDQVREHCVVNDEFKLGSGAAPGPKLTSQ